MIERLFTCAALLALVAGADATHAAAQEEETVEASRAAADAIDRILSGSDDGAAWSALENALDTEESTGWRALPGAEPEADSGLLGAGPLAAVLDLLPVGGSPGVVPTRLLPGVVAGAVAALLALLSFLTLRLLARTLMRAFRVVASRRRSSRTLVRRPRRRVPLSRDAERLEAQLRARRTA